MKAGALFALAALSSLRLGASQPHGKTTHPCRCERCAVGRVTDPVGDRLPSPPPGASRHRDRRRLRDRGRLPDRVRRSATDPGPGPARARARSGRSGPSGRPSGRTAGAVRRSAAATAIIRAAAATAVCTRGSQRRCAIRLVRHGHHLRALQERRQLQDAG